VRIVITPMSGAFTSGPKNDDAASHHGRHRQIERRAQTGASEDERRRAAEAGRTGR
jgi:hypothetical protein